MARLVERGLPETPDWDAKTDMLVAVGECGPDWAVRREGIREAKEALRRRLYGPGDRETRNRVLEAMADRFATWRGVP